MIATTNSAQNVNIIQPLSLQSASGLFVALIYEKRLVDGWTIPVPGDTTERAVRMQMPRLDYRTALLRYRLMTL
jgi:hypothetical protein